ncbi:hypothetical protein AMATHDRAFT_72900 [Amanita thiersii Skay4041]|uniref:RRM domain-containing protein n=1 Tax=Amanita thiersii Skay4041 TaxID=703135 RepID=A0A2A9NUT5_9AGAR|nr:hypothetical protein AMATHDRAFT_72900 [Amanita thiersii Skay4041]
MFSAATVNVSGIDPSITHERLHDFFTFCGKISSIDRREKDAIIHFEKLSAAKTAIMLNGGTLDGSTLTVTSDNLPQEESENDVKGDQPIDQSDKPRAGIAAEYLAKGYQLSDNILQRMIEFDQKQGISTRFVNYIHNLDSSLGARALGPDQTISSKVQATMESATQQAKAVDEQKGFSKIAHDYYARAISSSFGQRVKAFYTSTSKQVHDIHEEARRIADQQKENKVSVETTSETTAETGSSTSIPQPTTQAAPVI